ncbi:MAG TPA: di-heme oxidoredictase family protein [Vicinamibacterales bacterium]|nr:di-heme oxidoredictase family protein [Vicinamibacterales bacterium]
MKRLSILTIAAWLVVAGWAVVPRSVSTATLNDAQTGFSDLTNGVLTQAEFDAARDVFNEQESIAKGLGPVYNAQSCGECHQNPVSGGVSQVTEVRAGHVSPFGRFIDHPGGSLIHSRAIDATAQEHVLPGHEVRTLRTSLNTLGDGFVEAISNTTLLSIAARQPALSGGVIAGQAISVNVKEAGAGVLRIGRFGWKDQHASLVSFAADAYLNEMGITSPLQAVENTTNGQPIAQYDHVADPEDDGDDVETFAQFMRSTMPPARDAERAATEEAQRGERLFSAIGCNICHVTSITTAPAGTLVNGGEFVVPEALGGKVIHPFSDFLLHDIGTGDGIVQAPAPANKMRTAPLWGLRTHDRFMHDAASLTLTNAISRHNGEASVTRSRFSLLSVDDQRALLAFLSSL